MNPGEKLALAQLTQLVSEIKFRLDRVDRTDRYRFEKVIEIPSGINIAILGPDGMKIGTSTTQKIGFFNKTPVAQQATIADPSGGITQDAEARTAINSILDVLDALGFTA